MEAVYIIIYRNQQFIFSEIKMSTCVSLQWQHEDILGSKNQPLCVSIPPRSVILNNIKKKLYKLSQDEGAIVAIQVSTTLNMQFFNLMT